MDIGRGLCFLRLQPQRRAVPRLAMQVATTEVATTEVDQDSQCHLTWVVRAVQGQRPRLGRSGATRSWPFWRGPSMRRGKRGEWVGVFRPIELWLKNRLASMEGRTQEVRYWRRQRILNRRTCPPSSTAQSQPSKSYLSRSDSTSSCFLLFGDAWSVSLSQATNLTCDVCLCF